MNELRSEADRLQSQVVEWRRHFHKHAELSFQEFATSDFIEAKLKSFGAIEVARPTRTGVVGTLRGAGRGPTIALRADIDALPMTEANDLPFVSVNEGVMHSCGHDGHAAILLGIAKLFAGKTDLLAGTIVFIFQHAEEVPPGGAAELVAAGVMRGVDEVYGLHLTSTLPTGTFGLATGVLTSATDRFDIRVIGKGGHSSMPEQCVDPIVAAAQIVMGLQTIVARRISAYEKAVVSACAIRGGDAYNIIADEVAITGSVRTFSRDLRERMPILIREIADGIAKSSGASCETSYERGYDSVVNDAALAADVRAALAGWYGPESVLDIQPIMPGEDFSAFTEATGRPGCFVQVGTRSEAKGAIWPHHNAKFLLDEDGLRYGMGLFASLIERKLSAKRL